MATTSGEDTTAPERVAFIESVLRPFYEPTPQLTFHDCYYITQPWRDGQQFEHKWHVRLWYPCDGCSEKRHLVQLACYPERSTSPTPIHPSEDFVCALYRKSIGFWKRVHGVQLIGVFLDRARVKVGAHLVYESDGSSGLFDTLLSAWNSGIRECCRFSVARVLDHIFTCLLDHSKADRCMRVLPKTASSGVRWCFSAKQPRIMSLCFPHVWVAHCPKWGLYQDESLVLHFGRPHVNFFSDYEEIRKRVSAGPLPTRFVSIHAYSLGDDLSRVPLLFPHVYGVCVDNFQSYAALTKILLGFNKVHQAKFGIFKTRSSIEPWSQLQLMKAIAANRRLESLLAQGCRRDEDSFDVFENGLVDTYLTTRAGLHALVSADTNALRIDNPKRRRIMDARPVVQSAFFDSRLFEPRTLGIVDQFLHGRSWF